jgi:hypothetical protein
MKHNYHRQRVAFFIWCFVVSIIIGISFNGCSNQNTVTNTQLEQDAITFEKMTLVEPGTLNEAQVYYKETFDELGLNPQGLEGAVLVNSQDFIKMLVFLGFNGLKPEEIENLPSTELMSRFPNKTLLMILISVGVKLSASYRKMAQRLRGKVSPPDFSYSINFKERAIIIIQTRLNLEKTKAMNQATRS